MPRSYSFDHFQVPKKDTSVVHQDEKAKYAESHASVGEAKIQYGHAHAQTEELLIARQMNAQLEELAGLRQDQAPAPMAMKAELPEAKPLPKSAPIGALPVTETPMAGLPEGLFEEVSQLTANTWKELRGAAVELADAAWKLVKLPREVVMTAARHLRPERA